MKVGANVSVPQWMGIARKYVGIEEVPGPNAHPTLVQWAKNLGGFVSAFFRDDATPWCALFANAVLEQAGLPLSGAPGSADLLRARSFLTYGIALDTPALGAVLVFERSGGGGHVGFYVGETLKAYRVLGGNQGNCVSEAWIAKTRCLAVRWPTAAVAPGARIWLRPDSTPLSFNEA